MKRNISSRLDRQCFRRRSFLKMVGAHHAPPEPEFERIFAEIREGLKYLSRRKNEVLTFTSSGTGAMEGAVSNILSTGDKAIVVRGGKFGERWGEICKAYGIESSRSICM